MIQNFNIKIKKRKVVTLKIAINKLSNYHLNRVQYATNTKLKNR